jgi:hypothetical protein
VVEHAARRAACSLILKYLAACLACLPVGVFCLELMAAQRASSQVPRGATNLLRAPDDAWMPPDVDSRVPPVSGRACAVDDVLAGAGANVEKLVRDLDRFAAVERVVHRGVNSDGEMKRAQVREFEYVVSIRPSGNGYFSVQELRGRAGESPEFAEGIATQGTPSLVLIFHPLYAQDFDMQCEGLGSWRGMQAWQVRFEQRPDRRNRMSNVVVNGKMHGVPLRGRAWVLAGSYQLARLEMDLVEPVSAIELRAQHMAVEYRPVAFPKRLTELWLPSSAELYMDVAGRRFYRKHSFSDFTLFWVNVEEEFRPMAAVEP